MPCVSEIVREGRILVVDDNPTNVLILLKSLSKIGYEIITAVNGIQAVDLARERKPDLMLLDVMMPERDGMQVCRILHSDPATTNIPIIFVTARSEPDEIVKALSAGGCDYITKPFIISEVLARVSVQLRLRRTEREILARNEELERLSQRLSDMNAELAILTRTDPLTRLLNRRAWEESVTLEQERAERHGHLFGVCMLDVDCFKKFNDTLGHQAGDMCLRRVAEAIQGSCRNMDAVGRYGGEEFIILCPETNREGITLLAERVRRAILELNITHYSSTAANVVTVSVGAAIYAFDPWEQVVRRADDALYIAKESGRNRVCIAGTESADCVAQGAEASN